MTFCSVCWSVHSVRTRGALPVLRERLLLRAGVPTRPLAHSPAGLQADHPTARSTALAAATASSAPPPPAAVRTSGAAARRCPSATRRAYDERRCPESSVPCHERSSADTNGADQRATASDCQFRSTFRRTSAECTTRDATGARPTRTKRRATTDGFYFST